MRGQISLSLSLSLDTYNVYQDEGTENEIRNRGLIFHRFINLRTKGKVI